MISNVKVMAKRETAHQGPLRSRDDVSELSSTYDEPFIQDI